MDYDFPEKKFPTVVCLCGSTRFWRAFQKASLEETLARKIVLSIGAASGTDDEHFGNLPREEYERIKAMLDELHLRKIDLADEILVLNVGGYVGESTTREVLYAGKMGKGIRWLEPASVPPHLAGDDDRVICPECGANIPNDGNCWYCENQPAQEDSLGGENPFDAQDASLAGTSS